MEERIQGYNSFNFTVLILNQDVLLDHENTVEWYVNIESQSYITSFQEWLLDTNPSNYAYMDINKVFHCFWFSMLKCKQK